MVALVRGIGPGGPHSLFGQLPGCKPARILFQDQARIDQNKGRCVRQWVPHGTQPRRPADPRTPQPTCSAQSVRKAASALLSRRPSPILKSCGSRTTKSVGTSRKAPNRTLEATNHIDRDARGASIERVLDQFIKGNAIRADQLGTEMQYGPCRDAKIPPSTLLVPTLQGQQLRRAHDA